MGTFFEAFVYDVDVQHCRAFSFLLQLHQGDVIQNDNMYNNPKDTFKSVKCLRTFCFR